VVQLGFEADDLVLARKDASIGPSPMATRSQVEPSSLTKRTVLVAVMVLPLAITKRSSL
jgi:hypothetical protein